MRYGMDGIFGNAHQGEEDRERSGPGSSHEALTRAALVARVV